MSTSNSDTQTAGWNTYWHGTGSAEAFSAGGASHPALQEFWGEFFQRWGSRYPEPKYLDVATGNGAVIETALQILDASKATVSCVDVAPAAIENVVKRFPEVNGVVADAAAMPLDDAAYDLVTSQFGVEYAGPEAIFDAARLVASGGSLALLLHIEEGIVHRECADSLAAIDLLHASKFIPLATELFRHGFAAVRGGDRAPYDNAGSELAPAVAELEKILDQYGGDVAGGTLARLYEDVARIHSRMPNYEADDVLGWLETMSDEVVAYGERMSSMMAAATNANGFDAVCAKLEQDGFTIDQGGRFAVTGSDLPLAWILIARKTG